MFILAGLGQLLLLLTFVVSYRISKLILTLILKVYSHWNEMSSYIFVSFRELVEKNTTANCRGRGQPLAVDVFSSDNSRKDTKKYEKIRKNTTTTLQCEWTFTWMTVQTILYGTAPLSPPQLGKFIIMRDVLTGIAYTLSSLVADYLRFAIRQQ